MGYQGEEGEEGQVAVEKRKAERGQARQIISNNPLQQTRGREYAKSVTVREFRQFLKDNKLEAWFEAGSLAAPAMKRFGPDEDGPIIRVDGYRAAGYCNWLSRQEGIAEEQWCYETNARKLSQEKVSVLVGLLAPSHALARAAKARYLSLVLDEQPQVCELGRRRQRGLNPPPSEQRACSA
jgi:hypothetical protein